MVNDAVFSFNTLLPPTLESNARTREKSGKNDAKPHGSAIGASSSELSDCYPSPLAGEKRKNGMAMNPIGESKDARRALRRRKNEALFIDVGSQRKLRIQVRYFLPTRDCSIRISDSSSLNCSGSCAANGAMR